MEHMERSYLPAAGIDWALPLYDPLVKLIGADKVRNALVTQADLHAGQRVLDIGCGTGTLVAKIKQLYSAVEVAGIDPDSKALARATRKAEHAGVAVRFDQGFSDNLPYGDGMFDRVFSSFMFHHVPGDAREKTLREVRRVLAPGGSLHLVDFEKAEQGGILGRHLAKHHLSDNSEPRLLGLMNQAGFPSVTRLGGGTIVLGLLRFGYYRATCQSAAVRCH